MQDGPQGLSPGLHVEADSGKHRGMNSQSAHSPSDSHNTNHLTAVLLALSGFFIWSCGDAAIRSLHALPLPVVVFSYAASAVVVMSVFSGFLGGFAETFRRPKLKLRILRGVVLMGSNTLAVVAFTHLDMATAYALIFLSPFMAKIMSFLLLGEKPSLLSLGLSVVAFIGVLIILRPGEVPLNIGSAAALGLTVFFALGYTLGRFIGVENQTPLSMILFQYCFVSLASLPFAAPHFAEAAGMISLREGLVIAFSGFTAVFGTICASTGFARAPASVVAPLHYSQMLWGILFGLILFGEWPDGFTLLGGSVIIGAGLILITTTARKGKP